MPERQARPLPSLSAENRERLVRFFFFAAFLLLLHQLLRMLSPFFVSILGSAVLALMLYPLHAWILRRMKAAPSAAAVATTALIVVMVVVPILLLGWLFLKETGKVYPATQAWVGQLRDLRAGGELAVPPQLRTAWDRARGFLEFWNIDLQEILLGNLDELSANMTRLAAALIKNMAFIAFNLVVLAFTLFFFLRDGPAIIRRVTELIPMAQDHKQAILERLQDTLYAVLRGILIVAAVQGLLAGVGFALFGVPFPVLLGALATLLAPIPFVGTAAVWVPVVACLLLSGAMRQALYVGLWCLLVVSLVDNLLRPVLIGTRARIPILLLFFGLLGGLRVYGFMGLLVGPLVIALVLAFIQIYRQEYHWPSSRAAEEEDS